MFVQETKLLGQKGKNVIDDLDTSIEVDLDAEPEDADLVSESLVIKIICYVACY